MNTDTKHTKEEVNQSHFECLTTSEDDSNPIPQDSKGRKTWLDEAWAERGRNGLE